MSYWLVHLVIVGGCALVNPSIADILTCEGFDTIDYSIRDFYSDQPLFINMMPYFLGHTYMDNICVTFFPLPDDPDTYLVYESTVYCDGSNDVTSYVATDIGRGAITLANPTCTVNEYVISFIGCDTHLICRNGIFGSCLVGVPKAVGYSTLCRPLALSCLEKVTTLTDQEFYLLPMKLPNRCITQQACINVQSENYFYRYLGINGPSVTAS